MCKSGELGGGNVWVVDREESERYLEAESKRGGFFYKLKASMSLQQMDYCLLTPKEWVLRAFLVHRVAHFLYHTSPLCLPSASFFCWPRFCLLLFVALPAFHFC